MASGGIQGIQPKWITVLAEGKWGHNYNHIPCTLQKPWVNLFVAWATTY